MKILLVLAFSFLSLLGYSQATQGTRITAPIVPNDSSDVYPTHDDIFGRGGYRSVITIIERDAIKYALRKEGMLVKVLSDDKIYILKNGIDNSNWEELKLGLSHDALTIATANGLSLSGQQLSLGLASTTTTGALSAASFTSFNNIISFPGFGNTAATASAGNHLHSQYLDFYTGEVNPTLTTRMNVNGKLKSTMLEAGETTSANIGVYGKSSSIGVYGVTYNGSGVYGLATYGYGVHGESTFGSAVWGFSYSGKGVRGESSFGDGVYGSSGNGNGVYGSSGDGNGIVGYSLNGHAGVFTSTVTAASTLKASQGEPLVSSCTANVLELFRNNISGTFNTTGNLIKIIDNPLTSGTISGKVLSATIGTTERISLNPRVTNDASAVAYMEDTHNTLTTIGAKLKQIKNGGVEKAYIDKDGNYNSIAGNSSTFIKHGGTLKTFYTDASTVGTTETDLYSYTIPANVLAGDGDMIEVEYTIEELDINSTHIVRIYFDNTVIYSKPSDRITITIPIKIIRVSSSVVKCITTGEYSNCVQLTSRNFTISNILKITGEVSTVGVITAKYGTIRYYPAV